MTAVRLLLGTPLVLLLPGGAVTAALFAPQTLRTGARMQYSLALSLVIAIGLGLVLNVTPWGLQRQSWIIALGGVTLIALVLAQVRWWRTPPVAASRSVGPRMRDLVLLGLAGAVLVAALAIAVVGDIYAGGPGYSQLWIERAAPADTNEVRLGIRAEEPAMTAYRLQLAVDGTVFKEWPSIPLVQGQVWEATATVPESENGPGEVEAILTRSDTPQSPYRRVVLRP
jgi:hypothetical protein